MTDAKRTAVFADGGAYERFMGQRSRNTGQLFVEWLLLNENLRWLDVGCGTGALTGVILQLCRPGLVVGIDPSDAQIRHAQDQIASERAQFRVGDALDLPFEDNEFGVAVSSYVLNFVRDKHKKMTEMTRVVHPGGTVAVSVLDHAGDRDPARHFWRIVRDQDAPFFEKEFSMRGWDITRPEVLTDILNASGLEAVEVSEMKFEDAFLDFNDYWDSMTGLSTSSLAQYARTLDESGLNRFKNALERELPAESDGSIRYDSFSWFIRGRVGP